MKSPETDLLLATMIRSLRRYKDSRDRRDYDSFRNAKRRLYELWPPHRAKLLCRYALAKAGWHAPKVVDLD